VAVVRRRLGTRRVGHAGTLDPFATGLLVVLVGKATRLARFVEGLRKIYRGTIRFGAATATDDATGEIVRTGVPQSWPEPARITEALRRFEGGYQQRPPAFSALRVDGTRAYQLARRGVDVELPPRFVRIDALEMEEWAPPALAIRATVGRGTYLRALARDVGEALDIPAHCAELRRIAIGPFDVDDATAPNEVTPATLLPVTSLLPELPSEVLDERARDDVAHGRPVAQRVARDGVGALVEGNGNLVAVARGVRGLWHPMVVLETAP
jgi:tRNA pseudouridine55 synthase